MPAPPASSPPKSNIGSDQQKQHSEQKHGGAKHGSPPRSLHQSRSPSPPAVPVHEGPSVPPDIWTQKMLHFWKNALDDTQQQVAVRKKILVTIDDLAKHGENAKPIKLTSPRSIQACLQLGIDPTELAFRPADSFHERGLTKELTQIKFGHHEKLRKERIQKLQDERVKVIQKQEEECLAAAAAAAAAANVNHSKYKCPKDFQEKEKQRLEVMHRRQQRELEQVAKYEAQRQQMAADNQARADAERKAEEQKRIEKAKKEKEWQADIRKRELQKMKEEEAMERKSKQLAAERYIKEQEQLAQEQAQLRQLQKEAMRKEQERIAKQEEFRREVEKIQEAQQEVLRKKQEEMMQKEKERQRIMEEQNMERIRQNLEACKHAEARHANAVASFHELMRKREDDYHKRQEELRIKLAKQEEEHRRLEEEKKRREEEREQQRLAVIREARAERERRVQELLAKAEAADLILQNFIMRKQLEHARKVVENHVEFGDKHVRAESVKRVKALHRYQILQHIEDETDRVHKLLESKAKQENRHRKANVNLSIHRQSMLQKMEKLSISKRWRDTLSDADRAELEEAQKVRAANRKR